MLTRPQKEEQVADLRERFDRATGVIVADYRGIGVQEINELRSKLRGSEDEYDYRVSKNTLLRRAVEGSRASALLEQFQGPTAVAMSFGDPIALAKILVDFEKAHEVFEIRAGLLEGKAIDREAIATLATLPSLDELRSTLIGLIQARAQKIACVLSAPGGQLARVVEARRGQLEESGGA